MSTLPAAEGPEVKPDAQRSAEARAGLSEHKGLTNGSGRATEEALDEVDGAARPARSRKRSIFGRGSRTGAREGPGFLRIGGLTNGSGTTNGGGRVNGGRINGGRINGGQINGGRVNGGRVNGGRINGGQVNGGRVNGGRINGGRTNGNGLLYSQSIHQRRRAMTRRMAALLAVLFFVVLLFGPLLYSGLFAPPPVVVDGDFADWGSIPIIPDAPDDQPFNGDVNLVGFAGVASERDLYFYLQVAQGFHPFTGPNGTGAESFLLLIDSDRSRATGYLAWGLGVDYVVELSGSGGALRTSALKSYPQGAADRADATFFGTSGAVRAISSGNQIEGSVPLLSIGGAQGHGLPYLVLLAQDSLGREDLSDAVFSSRPGVLVMRQAPTPLGTIPTDADVPLLSIELRAYHQNITLQGLRLSVEGAGGAGITVSYALAGGTNRTLGLSASAGETVDVNFTSAGPLTYNFLDGAQRIDIWGRATGPSEVGTLRVFVAGSEDVSTGAPPAGRSGHGSIFPPAVFESTYVGAAPAGIRIDGAFADWGPTRPFDTDPDDDVSSPVAAPSPGGPNPPASVDQNIDIREARSDVNSGALQVSFYLAVDGSIMAGKLLGLPTAPSSVQPGQSGGSAPGESEPQVDIASAYIDLDSNFLTGWQGLPGLGIDAVLQVWGKGGGYGRTPHATQTSQWSWDAGTLRFNQTTRPIPVGFGSSKMEIQVPAADLCGGPCPSVRYAFFLQNTVGGSDSTAAFASTFRGGGEALYFSEGAPRTRNAFAGDLHVPLLAFSVSSDPSNTQVATVTAVIATITGILPSDVTAVSIFLDGGARGEMDSADLVDGPVASGLLLPSGFVQLDPTSAITIGPGESLAALLTADIAWNATAPAWLNATVAGVEGLRTWGVVDVRYQAPATPVSIRLFEFAPGTRGQNNLVINELNFVSGWIEIYDTTAGSTSLTSPAKIGLEIYTSNAGGGKRKTIAILDFTGSTNSGGFAVINYTLLYSNASTVYNIALWCSNCSAGQQGAKFNKTFLDQVQVPQNTTAGAWGRFPDGSGAFRSTTNNTRAAVNGIPEFQDVVVPLAGVAIAAVVRVSRRRAGDPGASAGEPSPEVTAPSALGAALPARE